MDAELCRIQLEEVARVKERKRLTFLLDGWEDLLKRSLYGALAAEINQYLIVLKLADMTGQRGSAAKLLEVSENALKVMDIEDAKNFIATTTDNPTIMQAFRKKFKDKFYWVLTFPCFLHGLNTLIGDICSHPWMKQQVTKATQIVMFFNGSHFWGGQLKDEAKRQKITCTLKKNYGGDNTGVWTHAKLVFNRQFHAMNTDHHSLALFLHPMCSANGCNFEFMVRTALWGEAEAKSLISNLKEYQKCTAVFSGGQVDALDWWECLPVTAKQCPLKAMAIMLHSIVPHAADVERYFSGLGGTQSAKRCNLTVETFKALSKLRSSYAHHLYKLDRTAGKSAHRKHAHMHTHPHLGIDTDLVDELVNTFTWVPPLAVESDESEESLSGPEAITDEELAD
ncbi:hypothetical protein BS17DRAFT_793315 [Gyrodon lividus]|nr:hypothetical protein BS17DRAFT_793315 [Gyrodon lividus]